MRKEAAERERENGGEEHEILQKISLTGDVRVQGVRKRLEISGVFSPQKIRGE